MARIYFLLLAKFISANCLNSSYISGGDCTADNKKSPPIWVTIRMKNGLDFIKLAKLSLNHHTYGFCIIKRRIKRVHLLNGG